MLEITENTEGVTFTVRVLPRSSRNGIEGELGGALRVKLTAPPVEGAANKLLVRFLASSLKVSKSSVRILRGETARVKTVHVTGRSARDISALIP